MDTLFEKVKESGNEVQAVKLKASFTPLGERTRMMSSKPSSPEIKILDMGKWNKRSLHSLDTNEANQWIITGGSNGHVGIWNNQTQRRVDYLKNSMSEAVTCVKFVARKQWFVVGVQRGDVHVYSYGPKISKITGFSVSRCHGQPMLLAVHPSQPYLLAACDEMMKVWDWDKDWECIQTFRVLFPCQVAFNPKDTIAAALLHGRVQVLSVHSPKSEYNLSGHSAKVNCLDFFTCGDQEYFVSGSDDQTAKIWDMEKKICVYTLEAFVSPIMSVLYQPNLQILIAGSKDGLIYLWRTADARISSSSPRLERIIDTGYGGAVRSLACLMGRVVIGKEEAVAIMDVENKIYQEESRDYSDALLSVSERLGDTTSEVTACSSELLDVHPLDLCFHHEPESEEHSMGSLHLTNKTDEHVAFRVTDKNGESLWWPCFVNLQLYGTVPPGYTCRLIVRTCQKEEVHTELVLQSSISGDKNTVLLTGLDEIAEFFNEAKELGHAVHELAVKFVYDPTERETTLEPVIPPRMKIISLKKYPGYDYCLDANPTEPWIITCHKDGEAYIWNCDSQELVHTFKISEQAVKCVKVCPREQWIVAQTDDGSIHVFYCGCVTQIKKIASFGAPVDRRPYYYSIGVHPTKPYVLTSSKSSMELWDSDMGWECKQTCGTSHVIQHAFNPKDPNSFATVSAYPVVQVWNLDSSDNGPDYGLSGHLECVNCLAYFPRGDRQHLISGSKDCTAKIWDLQTRTCIHTLEVFRSPVIHVISIPGRPYLVTCSKNATIHVWSSTDFRLKTTVNFSGGGPVRGLVCLMGSRRIAIGQFEGISILDIEDDEEAVAGEGNNEDSATCATG